MPKRKAEDLEVCNTISAGWNKQLEAGTVRLVSEFLFQYDISPLLPRMCHAGVRHEISCCFEAAETSSHNPLQPLRHLFF